MNPEWRRQKYRAFDLFQNSTARRVVRFDLWGQPVTVYANANFSIYSAQPCNAACRFCVEELRPASRGALLKSQRQIERDDATYFAALEKSLDAVRPLSPTISITGGEPSKDRRLPDLLKIVSRYWGPRKTLTTNGSGLRDPGVIDSVCEAGLDHLNISVAHPDRERNIGLMRLPLALTVPQLAEVVRLAQAAGTRVRLSCVLLREAVHSLETVSEYLAFARSVGVTNVIFRQLMRTDPLTHLDNPVISYSNLQRVKVEPILELISNHPQFTFVRQILGYYYYVEVWRYDGMDVVFEEADLAQIEAVKRRDPLTIHELIFHPNARLASTWQPWDGVLGPPANGAPYHAAAQQGQQPA
ncbi:MAG TPA: radical SAM protein [Bryobacteraceae bacterium]